ncbi:MAG: hypothetical protein K8T89_18320 [Planctomycetes bacterium]|nr:hypothetical protein [Planctomycetota bacterium]
MPDDEIALFNICTDLVSLRKAEAFPLHLFQSKRPGDWVCVREVCQRVGVPTGDLGAEVFATWLPDPKALDGYAVIMFYDDESKWSMAAHYHRARLLGGGIQTLQPTGAAVPISRDIQSMPAAPAGGA